jgi:hypothetical protein
MNILLACDSNYYQTWTINCINSIQKYVPWMKITVIIVNPNNINEIPNVKYVYDYVEFSNDDSRVAYYQAVRFIKCADLFPDNELVMSIDCDTILTKPFLEEEFKKLCSNISVLRHHKADRWMAGLVTYGNTEHFRKKIKDHLLSIPVEQWIYGWDQTALNQLSVEFNYTPIEVGGWMSFGKGKGKFLTLKGSQKVKEKFLNNYNIAIEEIINVKT